MIVLALGRAASPQRRSSNANSLYGQNSAEFPRPALGRRELREQ
jgi:hypothetical protein